MPEYSVQEVLEIIEKFSPQKKIELQEKLASVMSFSPLPAPKSYNSENTSQTFGGDFDVKWSGHGGNFEVVNTRAGRDAISTRNQPPASFDENPSSSSSIQQALEILQFLKTEVGEREDLNKLLRKNAEGTIEIVEEELKKPKPDKNLIDEAIESLKKGLEGVQQLAEPTMKVAALIARAWSVI